jgi:hypothetical protein
MRNLVVLRVDAEDIETLLSLSCSRCNALQELDKGLTIINIQIAELQLTHLGIPFSLDDSNIHKSLWILREVVVEVLESLYNALTNPSV